MKLSDIEKANSTKINGKMRDQLGWNLNLSALTPRSASAMMESIDNKLNAVRSSHKIHASEKDPNYVGMLMAKQVLESYIAEAKNKKPDADGDGVPDWADKNPGKDDKSGKKSKGGMTPAQAKYFGKGKKKVSEAELKVDEKAKSTSQQQAAGAALAAKRGDAPKSGLKGASKEMSKMPTKELEKFAKTKHKGLPTKVDESRLFEDELSQAQAMLAAKDMVDSMQDMIEEISKMLNEQLPPLADSIRAAIGSAEADSFKASASSTLNTLLQSVQTGRDTMDQSVRTLSGEPAAVTVPGDASAEMPTADDSSIDLPADDIEDDFSASDAAAGGELPLGREKR